MDNLHGFEVPNYQGFVVDCPLCLVGPLSYLLPSYSGDLASGGHSGCQTDPSSRVGLTSNSAAGSYLLPLPKSSSAILARGVLPVNNIPNPIF